MSQPLVSFVVPCYKLGHYLAECVESILSQTYRKLEVLIMDDCSPDNTPEVAKAFKDARVRYIRNEPNLGHLRNYNKGIEMSKGEYVWLMSADDKLRCETVVELYVRTMETHSSVGFACSAGMELRDTGEQTLAKYSVQSGKDEVFDGRRFLRRLLTQNTVLAPSGMVRRTCYDRLGTFPLDLPYAGDWYLWCLFALHHDVAFFAQPMVVYRIHGLSITNHLGSIDGSLFLHDDLTVLWRIRCAAQEHGDRSIVRNCDEQLVRRYALAVLSYAYINAYGAYACHMTVDQVTADIGTAMRTVREARWFRAALQSCIGDQYFRNADVESARKHYLLAIRESLWMPHVWAKYLLLWGGPLGRAGRLGLFKLRKALEQ